jgi:hypothetical protein
LDDPVKSSIEDYYLSSLTKNNNYLFAAASDGRVFRSSDGLSWAGLPIDNSVVLLDVQASTEGEVYACGERGVVFASSDNGESWSKKSTGVSAYLKKLIIYQDSIIFAGGSQGTLIKSTDRGESWLQLETPFSTSIADLALKDNQIYIGLRSNVSPTLIYKYDIAKDTVYSVDVEANSLISDISVIDEKLYFSDYNGTYELVESGQNAIKQDIHINSDNNFINQETLKYDGKTTLIGYYGFNLGEVIFDPQGSISIKDFEESIYFNSGIVFGNKLVLCGGDEMEIAVYQDSKWSIIKLK